MKFNNTKKYKYNITKKDLIGDLEDFPIEVVIEMINNQIKQGNNENVEVFQDDNISDCTVGGFTWSDTEEGDEFWYNVINEKDFDLFFEKHTK